MKRTSSILFALVLVLSLVLITAGPMASPVQAKSSGPHNGSTAADDDLIGTVTWDDVSNALAQDNFYASAILTQGNNTSHYLKVTNFGFAISGYATIEGIEVKVDRRENTVPLKVFDNSIRLVQDGTPSGDDRSAGAEWPSSDTNDYESYGNSTDLWGLTWEPDDINSSDFGVAISAVLDGSAARNAMVDHIQITVHYSVPEYYLTMVASPPAGGDATDETKTPPYEEDEEVNIKAEAATGYEFVNWMAVPTSDGFANANAPDTIFTMPGYNVTVTANFQVETGPQTPPTVTTVAASGISQYSATLNMDYDRGDWEQVNLQFAYKEHGTIDWSYTGWLIRAQDGSWHKTIRELTADTEYDFQAQLKYANIVIDDAAILQFKTDESSSTICFIATAAYGTPSAEQIDVLREFRDSVLLESIAGSLLVSLYYQLSPPIADFIAGNELLRTLVRELLLDPIVCVVEATGDIWRN